MPVKNTPDFDIREYKKNLRASFKEKRLNMSFEEKSRLDSAITSRFLSTTAYKSCKTLLTYVSTAIEVDTIQIIKTALSDDKIIAVPRCVPGTRDMIFYIINSLDDLEAGSFSVLEPIVQKCTELTDFNDAVCIVPALAYDMNGYRLGYGKGYYDRFLSSHKGMTNIGIEYCCCTVPNLISGRYDVPAEILITEKYTKIINITKHKKINPNS